MTKRNRRKKKKQVVNFDFITALNDVYAQIPETTGCLENISKEFGGCQGYCCFLQNPHLLSCEFENAWRYILKEWSVEQIVDVIGKSLRNYLAGQITKGCVMWDEKTKLCKCHKHRPLSCYLYSITPDEEFSERMNRVQEKYKNNPLMIFRPQCKLVSTVDGKKVTKEDTDKWWNEIIAIEQKCGVSRDDIKDEAGGTYLTFHDHLLLKILPEYLIENLARVRLYGTPEEKEGIIITISNLFSKQMAKEKDGTEPTGQSDSTKS